MTRPQDHLKITSYGWLLALLIILFVAILIRRAWISDDAFITFRTIDNLLHGYGLTWNPGERVQSYTHTLWLMLLTLVGLFTKGELVYTTILVSIVISLITVLILVFWIAVSRVTALFLVFTLILSNAFVDYSTSGLENPLSHLLFVIFFVIYFGLHPVHKKIFWLSCIAAWITLSRQDLSLLLLPTLLFTLAESGWAEVHAQNQSIYLQGIQNARSIKVFQAKAFLCTTTHRLMSMLLGFLPLVIWEGFSLIYYGFPFPNTAYAKLNSGIPALELAAQGFRYIRDSVHTDPLTLAVTGSSILLAFMEIFQTNRSSTNHLTVKQRINLIPLGLGIILYLLYIVKIGGDFMSGRFLTAPFLTALIILARFDLSRLPRLMLILIFVVIGTLGFLSQTPTLNFWEPDLSPKERSALVHSSVHGIANERQFYYPTNGLLRLDWQSKIPQHPYALEGLEARANSPTITRRITVGMFGYYAGPQVHVVDVMGLGDALLARLPARYNPNWRIGHFHRTTPAGYLESLTSGQNQLNDANLAEYYDQLVLITRGRLLDPARLSAIWKMNTGQFDNLINFEEYRFPK